MFRYRYTLIYTDTSLLFTMKFYPIDKLGYLIKPFISCGDYTAGYDSLLMGRQIYIGELRVENDMIISSVKPL